MKPCSWRSFSALGLAHEIDQATAGWRRALLCAAAHDAVGVEDHDAHHRREIITRRPESRRPGARFAEPSAAMRL
jgi:hypothetical protein